LIVDAALSIEAIVDQIAADTERPRWL